MKLLKAGKVITIVMEVIAIIGAALSLGMMVMAFVNPQWLLENGTFRVNGLDITKPLHLIENPSLPMGIVFLSGAVATSLAALMSHRMHGIIVETMAGRPFQSCTVKWMKQIGYCAVAGPLLGAVMSIVAMLLSVDGLHATLDLGNLLTGILVLCLTQVFAYGLELQKDVDELL